MLDPLHIQLVSALRRVQPYCDRLPDTAAEEVRAALEAYDLRKTALLAAGEGEKNEHIR